MSASPGTAVPEPVAQGPQAQPVTCPHCGQQFPLSEALAEELARHVLAGKEPALRAQIAQDVSTRYASDLQALQEQLRDQDDARKHDAEVIKKLRDDEITLRQERRKLESDQAALRLEKERMRDEIRTQERAEADRRAEERAESELQKKDQTHAIQVREFTRMFRCRYPALL